jgi:serine/threonine protein phosphatase PrpC
MLSAAGGRRENQDAVDHLVLAHFGCWVIADGLGGHGGGAMAAKTAVKAIIESFQKAPSCSAESLLGYFARAQDSIRALQHKEAHWSEMATTAVILLSDLDSVLWGHVGDSRLYFFRQGTLEHQTLDHSLPQALCSAGEITPGEIRFHEDRNRLLRALGQNDGVQPAIHDERRPLERGDVCLLCTDGFWEYVTEEEMQLELRRSPTPESWLRRMESRLNQGASGEHDNYSGLAVYFD